MSFDPWQVIDRYFKRDPYYLTAHHHDSYNQFLNAGVKDEIGLEYIIKRNNPIKIFKGQEGNHYNHEISIYLGEHYEPGEEQDEKQDEEKHIYFGTPILFKDSPEGGEGNGDKTNYMYPNLARNYNTTYAANVFIDVTIIIRKYDTDSKKMVTEHYEYLSGDSKINIGKIPIMVHSDICLLRNMNSNQLKQLGECRYDKGGYFIINGKEKVILSQETKINNINAIPLHMIWT